MLRRDQDREHHDPSGADLIVVPPLTTRSAAHLDDLNSPTRATVIEGPALQPDRAVA
jgi:hypothetical protein